MRIQAEPLTASFGAVVHPAREGQQIGDLDTAEVLELYRESGAVLFKGFKVTNEQFVVFSDLHLVASRHPMRAPYEHEPAFKGKTIYDVDPNRSGGSRDLHSEASDTGVPIGTCCFFCEQASPIGGETTLGDGVEILNRLDAKTRALFDRSRITYRFTFSNEGWSKFFGCEDPGKVAEMIAGVGGLKSKFTSDGGLIVAHSAQAVLPTRYGSKNGFVNAIAEYLRGMEMNTTQHRGEVTLDDDSALPAAVAEDVVRVCRQAEIGIPWADGDLVLVDNTRVLHGRRPWPLQYDRKIYAKFGELKC